MSRHPLDCLSAAQPGDPLLSPKTPDYAPGKKSGAAFKTLTQAVKAAEACRNAAADSAREADRSALAAALATAAAKKTPPMRMPSAPAPYCSAWCSPCSQSRRGWLTSSGAFLSNFPIFPPPPMRGDLTPNTTVRNMVKNRVKNELLACAGARGRCRCLGGRAGSFPAGGICGTRKRPARHRRVSCFSRAENS